MVGRQGIKIVPIIVGVLTESVGSVATAMLLVVSLAASGVPDYDILPRMHSFSGLMLTVIANLGFTGAGGYFAGQMARQAPVLHGAIVATVGLVLTVLCREEGMPLWFSILSLGGMIPAGMMGGLVARQQSAAENKSARNHDA